MTSYFIGLGDGNRELNEATVVLEPLGGPPVTLLLGEGTGNLIASPAVVTGPAGGPVPTTFVPAAADVELLVPTVVESPRPTNPLLAALFLPERGLGAGASREVVVAAVLLETLGVTTSIGATALFVTPVLAGQLALAVIPIPSADLYAELNDGVRPCLPWQVQTMAVAHIFDLTETGGAPYKFTLNQAFVVAATFSEDPDDELFKVGGKRNFIGVVLDDGQGSEVLRFRPPYAGEVIYNFDANDPADAAKGSWRFDPEIEVWVEHVTIMQRSTRATRAFDVLDPDGIYDYTMQLLGLMLFQHQYDTRRIQDFVDPARVPEAFLPLLLRNFGADDIFADSTFADQQEALRVFVALMKQKGTPESIVNALNMLGFKGHGSHVWAIPQGDPTKDWTCKPFGIDNVTPDPTMPTTEYFPSSAVCIHINDRDGNPILKIDDATKQFVAEFLARNILPAHAFIRTFATDLSADGPPAAATGSVTITSGLNVADGDTVALTDTFGRTVTFEFESAGGVAPGNILVTIGIDDDASALNLANAINAQNTASNLDITAVATLNVVDLTQDTVGAAGNTTITVVGVNLSKVDFTGGESIADTLNITDSLTITP